MIPDAAITASSSYVPNVGPYFGRYVHCPINTFTVMINKTV